MSGPPRVGGPGEGAGRPAGRRRIGQEARRQEHGRAGRRSGAGENRIRQEEAHIQQQVNIQRGPGGSAKVLLVGSLDVRTAAGFRAELRRGLSRVRVAALDVDATGVERGDMSGMVILYELSQGRFTKGVKGRVTGLRPELQRILAAFCAEEPAAPRRPHESLPERVGASVLASLGHARGHVTFVGGVAQAFVAAARRPALMRWSEVGRVFDSAGVDALPIVSLVSLLTGFIIAFEAAQPLAAYGAQIYLANTIGRVMTRELGPIMTAVVLAGRSGSAFAAELGTMKVNEELDALETMGLEPLRFLVVQRILAGTALTPLLTVYAMALGVLGGLRGGRAGRARQGRRLRDGGGRHRLPARHGHGARPHGGGRLHHARGGGRHPRHRPHRLRLRPPHLPGARMTRASISSLAPGGPLTAVDTRVERASGGRRGAAA
jgi:phospholipid/cholesterol/gamma-HCH transport system permease protein